jgi:hypothetical protein
MRRARSMKLMPRSRAAVPLLLPWMPRNGMLGCLEF